MSDDAAAAVLGFGEGFLVAPHSPSPDGSDAEAADDHADDDADGGHGVCALEVAVVDVAGKQVGGAGAGEERCCAGARAAVAHDPGADAHVEAGRRGHVGSAGGGAGVVAALVDGGEMHFRSGGGCGNGGVGDYGGLIGFQTSRMIVKYCRSTCGCFASLRVDGERSWLWRETLVEFCVNGRCRMGA